MSAGSCNFVKLYRKLRTQDSELGSVDFGKNWNICWGMEVEGGAIIYMREQGEMLLEY